MLEELNTVINRYGFENVIFEDDNICLVRKRAFKIFRAIEKLGVNFRMCPRADSMDKKLLKVAKESGVTEISFGVESGSQKMLDRMNKRLSVTRARQAIKEAKSIGMIVKVYLIVGFPGETWQSVEETKQFIKDTEPDKWLLQNFVPYPGTDVWNNPTKYGVTRISHDFDKFYTVGKGGKGGVVFRTEKLDGETIRAMHDNLFDFLMDFRPMNRS